MFKEAKERPKWERDMIAKHENLMKIPTCNLTALTPGKKPIGCKWVYKVKYKENGTLDKYKARLVAKGFSQRKAMIMRRAFLLQQRLAPFNWF